MEEFRISILIGILLIVVSFLQLTNYVQFPDFIKILNISIIFLIGTGVIIFTLFLSSVYSKREEKIFDLKAYMDKHSLNFVISKFSEISEKVKKILKKKYEKFAEGKINVNVKDANKILRNIKDDLKELSIYKPFLLKFKIVNENFLSDLNYILSLKKVKRAELADFNRSLQNILKVVTATYS